jgi:hypothetical protein
MPEQRAPWQDLLLEAISEDLLETWGWERQLFARSESQLRPPGPTDKSLLGGGGLLVPYYCGWICVDFAERQVVLDADDQKTPADNRWTLKPDGSWWARAMACDWPFSPSKAAPDAGAPSKPSE